jgi:hypothetical protein
MTKERKSKNNDNQFNNDNLFNNQMISNVLPNDFKDTLNHKVLASEISLKRYIDNRLEIYFDALNSKISDAVDSKYRKIHSQRGENNLENNQEEGITKEMVLNNIELAISEDIIDEHLERYMAELKKLR